jgi:hypothetical protein
MIIYDKKRYYEIQNVYNVSESNLYNPEDISIAINDLIEKADDGDKISLGSGVYKSRTININTGKKIEIELLGLIELITDNVLFSCTNKFHQNQKIVCSDLITSVSGSTCFALRGYSNSNIKVNSIVGFDYGLANIPNRTFFDVYGTISSGNNIPGVDNPQNILVGDYIKVFGNDGVFIVDSINGNNLTLNRNATKSVENVRIVNVAHKDEASVTDGSPDIDVIDGSVFSVGDKLSLAYVTGDYEISSISLNTLTLDSNVVITNGDSTRSGVEVFNITGSTVSGTKQITVSDYSNLEVGMILYNSAIGQKTITGINGNIVDVIDTIFADITDIPLRILEGSTGNQYNVFEAQLMECDECNIYNAVGEYDCWVNENLFRGFQCKGKNGVFYEKFINAQTLWSYDNNKYYDIGFEGLTSDAVKLSNTTGNLFSYCRMEETVSGDYIYEDESCDKSTFLLNGAIEEARVKLYGTKSRLEGGYLNPNGSNYHREILNNTSNNYITIYKQGDLFIDAKGTMFNASNELYLNTTQHMQSGMTISILGVDTDGVYDTRIIDSVFDNYVTTTVVASRDTSVNTEVLGVVTITADTTQGSNQVTVSDSTYLRKYLGISIVGVSGISKITDISGNTLTLDKEADVSVSGASVTTYSPKSKYISTLGVTAQVFDGYNVVSVNDGTSFNVNDYVYIEGVKGLKQITSKSGTFPALLTLDSDCEVSYMNRSLRVLYKGNNKNISNDYEVEENVNFISVDSSSNTVDVVFPRIMNTEDNEIILNVKTFTNAIYIKNYLDNIVDDNIDAIGLYKAKFLLGRWNVYKISDGTLW